MQIIESQLLSSDEFFVNKLKWNQINFPQFKQSQMMKNKRKYWNMFLNK